MARWIVDKFESARCGLKLQDGSYIDVTEEEVERVLRIPKGQNMFQKRADTSEDKAIISEWKTYFIEFRDIRPSGIAKMMMECEDELWFKRLFCLFFLTMIVEINQKGTVKNNF